MERFKWGLASLLLVGWPITAVAEAPAGPAAFAGLVTADEPVAYWRFSETEGNRATSHTREDARLTGTLVGAAKLGVAGPRRKIYPLFDEANHALAIQGGKSFVRVADPGEKSSLDFGNGDAITIEAWVKPDSLGDDQQVYIVGKGRTNNKGAARDNQNYALRLRGMGGLAHVSFLFRKAATAAAPQQFHRWNSRRGFVLDGTWHHVAIVYEFGKPYAIRAYLDGQESSGSWDMGGPTTDPPVVDNDELWTGSASGGNPGNTFQGLIDEVAIYRKALDPNRLQERYQAIKPDPREVEFAAAQAISADRVAVELYENVGA